ncbi:MAG: hypothetical protein ACREV5_01345 [Steroidobacter sp.]
MCSRHRNLRAIAATFGLALSTAIPVTSNSAVVVQEAVIDAIWRVQHLDFEYYSPHYAYTCDALKEKVRTILKAMGAHAALSIDAGCSGDSLVQQLSARISLATPMEATAENLRAATTFDTRDQLAAKLRNRRLPSAADVERFPASWRRISLSRDSKASLEAGDCDLLNSIRKQLLPRLGVNVKDWRRHCNWQATRLRSAYEVEALVPTPVAPVAHIGT